MTSINDLIPKKPLFEPLIGKAEVKPGRKNEFNSGWQAQALWTNPSVSSRDNNVSEQQAKNMSYMNLGIGYATEFDKDKPALGFIDQVEWNTSIMVPLNDGSKIQTIDTETGAITDKGDDKRFKMYAFGTEVNFGTKLGQDNRHLIFYGVGGEAIYSTYSGDVSQAYTVDKGQNVAWQFNYMFNLGYKGVIAATDRMDLGFDAMMQYYAGTGDDPLRYQSFTIRPNIGIGKDGKHGVVGLSATYGKDFLYNKKNTEDKGGEEFFWAAALDYSHKKLSDVIGLDKVFIGYGQNQHGSSTLSAGLEVRLRSTFLKDLVWVNRLDLTNTPGISETSTTWQTGFRYYFGGSD